MTGESHFSEVFLTDVAIPASSVLGGEAGIGQGWAAAVHTLANERAMIGSNSLMADLDDLIGLARERRDASTTRACARSWPPPTPGRRS